MDHSQARWGRPRDDVYGPYDASFTNSHADPKTATLAPQVTGSSVVGIKFNGGVVIAADNLASYGSLRRFEHQRVFSVGNETILGVGGEISDLQTLQDTLEELSIEESYDEPSQRLGASNVRSYLQRVMYQRRSKMDPYWNSILVGGYQNDEPFLAFIDLLGTTYTSPTLATGMGSYLAIPILRKVVDKEADVKNVSEEQARTAVAECMKVLFYRDGRAMDKYTLAVIKKNANNQPEISIEQDQRIPNQNWEMA